MRFRIFDLAVTEGKREWGASSPEKPALIIPVPESITTELMSSIVPTVFWNELAAGRQTTTDLLPSACATVNCFCPSNFDLYTRLTWSFKQIQERRRMFDSFFYVLYLWCAMFFVRRKGFPLLEPPFYRMHYWSGSLHGGDGNYKE